MIKLVIGKNDRIVATHSISDEITVEMYAASAMKRETLRIVTVSSDMLEQMIEEGTVFPSVSVSLKEGWSEA